MSRTSKRNIMQGQRSRVDRIKLILVLTFMAILVVIGFGGVRSKATSDNEKRANTSPARNEAATINAQAKPTPSPQPAATPAAFQEGCLNCHTQIEPMHVTKSGKLEDGKDGQKLSCTFCHGGNPAEKTNKDLAHVQPRYPDEWKRNGQRTSSNPESTNTLLEKESYEFVRFINPGDLRVIDQTCGACHSSENYSVSNSMMRHGAMLWGAALYNNGGYPLKDTHFGESYSERNGAPERLIQEGNIKPETMTLKGILAYLDPLPRWEISQPGNILRVFERGSKRRLEVALPDKDEDPGRPDKGLSPRGFGTANRTDPVYLGLQKTRLLDPTLNFLGTNNHPGDYRSSGCTACHVIYANDSSPVNSSKLYAQFGNLGTPHTADKSFDNWRNEPGHPIRHQLTTGIPSSQCMVCHMHPGNNMVATYLGLTWWDNETDGKVMYPATQHNPTQDEEQQKLNRNPEASNLRGLWSDEKFLEQTGTPQFNQGLTRTQFADFHGHGWIFRAVFKRDRQGRFLDKDGKPIENVNADALQKAVAFTDSDNYDLKNNSLPAGAPVHLKDIHLEKGMHCVDCHFRNDAHGNGILYNEPRAAIEIGCIDCHGTIQNSIFTASNKPPRPSGPAAGQKIVGGNYVVAQERDKLNLAQINAAAPGTKVFERIGGTKPGPHKDANGNNLKDANGKDVIFQPGDVIQHSMVDPNLWWRVKQTKDTVTEGNRDYNWKSAYAKTVRLNDQGQLEWGKVDDHVAHKDDNLTCFTCHSSWMTSCFGCHLSMQANRKMPNRHNEGGDSRNYTTYNFQVLRDDVFMLGVDGTATGHRVAPVRSSSAILVSSQNQNREWIYSQQQTVSAEGYAGQTFNTHVPHTVRAKETKDCEDCHVSKDNNNNAWLAQTYLEGTNFVNFMGRYVYVAAEDSLEAVTVTEHTEPQAVYGSTLQKLAYPADYERFVNHDKRRLSYGFEHTGNPKVLQVQLRGEYAYVAAGTGGLRVYDVAQIDQKGFSERISTAPVSPFGQKFYVKTKYATAVAAPSTLAVDPARWRLDREVGWFDPLGNDEKSQRAWARYREWAKLPEETRNKTPNPWVNEEQPIHPLYAYLYVADREEGLILVNAATLLDGDPLNNYLKRALDPSRYPNGAFNPDGALTGANNITIAGTYAYITTDSALVIININNPLEPRKVASIPLNHPRAVAIQFRYGFIADKDGLKVIDVTNPERARLIDGATLRLNDARDVYVARTYAYIANGREGVAIVDVENPEKPALYMMYNAAGEEGGALKDTNQVKIAMTNASLYAYVADGEAGLRILQLTDPETMPTYAGFSPKPQPRLIATFKTKGPALAVSKGLDRDRAVDESGNQTAVFGRRGARPFTLFEMQRMYLTKDGRLFTVSDIRQMDEKSPLPKVQQALAPNQSSPSTAQTEMTGTVEAAKPVSATTKTSALVGGLGLFCILVGWRKVRSLRRSDRST
jgi:hypothetical protein